MAYRALDDMPCCQIKAGDTVPDDHPAIRTHGRSFEKVGEVHRATQGPGEVR